MLAAFSAKYEATLEGPTPPKRQRQDTEKNLLCPGPSGERSKSTEPTGERNEMENKEDHYAMVEIFPEAWDTGDKDDAVDVRGADPEEGRAEELPSPTFSFRPPQPAVWPQNGSEEREPALIRLAAGLE